MYFVFGVVIKGNIFQCAKLLGPLLLKAILGVSGAMQMLIATARHLILRRHTSSGFCDDSQDGCTMVPNYGLLVVSGFIGLKCVPIG